MNDVPYKTLRFEAGEIPDGLRRDHRLKKGTRGDLHVVRGTVVFVDAQGARTTLREGEHMPIESEAVHHLEDTADCSIEIRFFRDV